MKCKDCRYWEPSYPNPTFDDDCVGSCFRYPPCDVLKPSNDCMEEAFHPIVAWYSWCGEFSAGTFADEQKGNVPIGAAGLLKAYDKWWASNPKDDPSNAFISGFAAGQLEMLSRSSSSDSNSADSECKASPPR